MKLGLRLGSPWAQLKLARGFDGRDLRACQMLKVQGGAEDLRRALALYEAAAETSAEAQLCVAAHYEGMKRSRFKIGDTYEMPSSYLDPACDKDGKWTVLFITRKSTMMVEAAVDGV